MWYFGHARGASAAHGGSSGGGGGDDNNDDDMRREASDSSESSEAKATIGCPCSSLRETGSISDPKVNSHISRSYSACGHVAT